MPTAFTSCKNFTIYPGFVSSTNSAGPHRTYPHLAVPYKFWIHGDRKEAPSILVQNSITPTRVQGASEEHYKMCYKVDCDKCGKFTWKGCGKHVKSVYDGIEKGKHCACKEWPGVETKVEGSASTTKEGEAKA